MCRFILLWFSSNRQSLCETSSKFKRRYDSRFSNSFCTFCFLLFPWPPLTRTFNCTFRSKSSFLLSFFFSLILSLTRALSGYKLLVPDVHRGYWFLQETWQCHIYILSHTYVYLYYTLLCEFYFSKIIYKHICNNKTQAAQLLQLEYSDTDIRKEKR